MPTRTWPVAPRGLLLLAGLCTSCSLDVEPLPPSPLDGAVGIGIDVVNGTGSLTLLPGQRFYVEQLRFQVRQTNYPAADVMDWLTAQSELASADWTGLARVRTEYSEGADGRWREVRPYLDAAWMKEPASFRLVFVNAQGVRLAPPIMVEEGDYITARKTAIAWIDGEPAPGELGSNSSSYPNLALESDGVFTGSADEVFEVRVTTGGPLDGTAEVGVRSARGPVQTAIPVQSGAPIRLGTEGATLELIDSGATILAQDDRWVVRCTAGAPAPACRVEPGIAASLSAVAELRLQGPKLDEDVTFTVPPGTARLDVQASTRPGTTYSIPVTILQGATVGYGLDVRLDLDPPANGVAYLAGETVHAKVALADADGRLLHHPEMLPTYRQFVGDDANGIEYFRLDVDPSAGFFTEYRLNIMRVAVAGPRHRMSQRYGHEEADGAYAREIDLPDIPTVVYAGLAPGSTAWDTPIPTRLDIELPDDAEPGTYVALAKAARSFAGQSVYRMIEVTFQVGGPEVTLFEETVGNCDLCHTKNARLARLRHGLDTTTPRLCEPCHVPPHGTVGTAIHTVHFFSPSYPARKSGCALCHLRPGSNTRASVALCGSCHGAIHEGEGQDFGRDPYAQCGQTCHRQLPPIHDASTNF